MIALTASPWKQRLGAASERGASADYASVLARPSVLDLAVPMIETANGVPTMTYEMG